MARLLALVQLCMVPRLPEPNVRAQYKVLTNTHVACVPSLNSLQCGPTKEGLLSTLSVSTTLLVVTRTRSRAVSKPGSSIFCHLNSLLTRPLPESTVDHLRFVSKPTLQSCPTLLRSPLMAPRWRSSCATVHSSSVSVLPAWLAHSVYDILIVTFCQI